MRQRLGRHRLCGGAVSLLKQHHGVYEYRVCTSCRQCVPEDDIEPDVTEGGLKQRRTSTAGKGFAVRTYRGYFARTKNKLR